MGKRIPFQDMISIIVPVYNTEKYLDQCIQSVLAQTYTNWELLLIDDGSTDSSGALCDKYAVEDKRIRVFHKENGGVSSARNRGLDNAIGEWITFVDADDILKVNALSHLAQRRGPRIDFIIAGYEKHDAQQNIIDSTDKENVDETMSGMNTLVKMYTSKQYLFYSIAKLYRNKIIQENHIRFNEAIAYNEDRLFIIQYMLNIRDFVSFSMTSIYEYHLHAESAMAAIATRATEKSLTAFTASILSYQNIHRIYADCHTPVVRLAKEEVVYSYRRLRKVAKKSPNSRLLIKRLNKEMFANISHIEYYISLISLRIQRVLKYIAQLT